MTRSVGEELSISKLAGQVIGCTGSGPYDDVKIKKNILEGFGIIGNQDVWQHDQVIVVGNIAFDRIYLQRSLEIGQKFGFMCHYMSQQDFLSSYLQGKEVRYTSIDHRIHDHRGLSFLASLKQKWPDQTSIHRVNWRILPPGEYPFSGILDHFRQLQQDDGDCRIDEERLEFVYDLDPSDIYIGTDEFKKYIIFYFAHLEKAVLECPFVGNAIYVINGEWESLSQYTKADLMQDSSGDVRRIIHSGTWRHKLRRTLGIRRG